MQHVSSESSVDQEGGSTHGFSGSSLWKRELKVEEIMLEGVRTELEESRSAKKVQRQSTATMKMAKGLLSRLIRVFVFYLRVRNYPGGLKKKSPLEEVKNQLPSFNNADGALNLASQPTSSTYHIASMETPISRPI